VTRTLVRPKKTQADHRIRSARDCQKFHHSRHSFGHGTGDHSQFLPRHKRTAGSPSAFCLRAGNSPGLPRGCSAAGDRLGVLPGGAPALLGAFSGGWARGRGGGSALSATQHLVSRTRHQWPTNSGGIVVILPTTCHLLEIGGWRPDPRPEWHVARGTPQKNRLRARHPRGPSVLYVHCALRAATATGYTRYVPATQLRTPHTDKSEKTSQCSVFAVVG
jgi:hypothetical protein